MVTIRLQRRGKIHKPFYHIVAADSRNSATGKFIERLGHYDPNQNPSLYAFDKERVQYWFGKGAKLSSAVESIMKNQKVTLTRDKTNGAKAEKA